MLTPSLKALSKSQRLNYLQSCPYPRRRQALLSIRPEFADAIFKGTKKFEFRRSTFKRDVDVVVVYVTSPIQRVIGEFDVKSVLREQVCTLWSKTAPVAGIDEERFMGYFDGLSHGYALEIGKTRLYEEPLLLGTHFGVHPPQSFMYLDFTWPICKAE
jgi:predicted transcriptional regulator